MAQYKTGQASVTQGSPVVAGVGTAWLDNVKQGNSFILGGSGVVYDVASVESNEELTLTAPYRGTTQIATYAVQRDFTADGIPEMAQGDIETPAIFTRAMRKIQSKFNLLTGVAANGTQTYPDTAAGLAATEDTGFFWVPSPEGLTLYQNDNGAAVSAGEFPTSQALQTAVDAMNDMEGRWLALIASLHPDFAGTSLYADLRAQSFVIEV